MKHVKIDPRFKNVEVSCRPIVCDTDSRPARYEFANVMLPPVFASSTSASAYLDSLSLEDDREAARILLESDSKSGLAIIVVNHMMSVIV